MLISPQLRVCNVQGQSRAISPEVLTHRVSVVLVSLPLMEVWGITVAPIDAWRWGRGL